MHSMQSIVPVPLIERGLVSQDAESLTWTCPTCGDITPGRWGTGWFYRRLCPCQNRAEEERRRREAESRLQATSVQQRRALVYSWLGSSWREPGWMS